MYHPVDAQYILTLKVCAETAVLRLNNIKHSHALQADKTVFACMVNACISRNPITWSVAKINHCAHSESCMHIITLIDHYNDTMCLYVRPEYIPSYLCRSYVDWITVTILQRSVL